MMIGMLQIEEQESIPILP